jgi:hypothetical protein
MGCEKTVNGEWRKAAVFARNCEIGKGKEAISRDFPGPGIKAFPLL